MQRTLKRLTAREVATAKPDADRRTLLLCDGGNLHLQVSRDPVHPDRIHRSWVFRYQFDGRRHDLGLGPTHSLDLAEARLKARTLRQQLLDGIDPLAIRQQQQRARLEALAAQQRAMTFRQCAEACMAGHEKGWSNDKHRQQWTNTLRQYAFPVLGDLAVDDITTAHVVKALEPIWQSIPETASRVRARIERVLAWAAVRGFRGGDNPARWRGHLAELFPAKGKVSTVEHHEAIPFADVPALIVELHRQDGIAALAIEFLILTAARLGEVLGIAWDEIDLATATWTVPARRMKGRKEHRVPLSERAVAILADRPRDRAPFEVSGDTMLRLLKAVRPDATLHGFRSSFRDWCSERTSYPEHIAEAALAHVTGDKVERAYKRTDLFEKRRRLMNDWAAWCATPAPSGATVTPIAGAR